MGIWQTNKASFKVNIGQSWIGELRNMGSKFCWMRDNEDAMTAFKEYIQKDKQEVKQEDKPDNILEAITSDGDTVRGYIGHIVNGTCSGTPLSDWFIICPER